MKILVTGSSGMLGIALCKELARSGYKTAGIDMVEPLPDRGPQTFVKVSVIDCKGLASAVEKIKPDVIIHAAAYTDVDGCESDPDKAETINALGTRYVAEAAAGVKAALIYVSTDFVFDGRVGAPHKEDDATSPINVYGKSKLHGEQFITAMKGNSFIIRTSWLFGKGGRNFVDTILEKAGMQKSLKIVTDQFGSPTYADDLALGIIKILEIYKKKRDICGTYHITNSDDCSWYRFAESILRLANIYGVELVPITSEELARPAERPRMSILDNSRYIKLTGEALRPWRKALEEYITCGRTDV